MRRGAGLTVSPPWYRGIQSFWSRARVPPPWRAKQTHTVEERPCLVAAGIKPRQDWQLVRRSDAACGLLLDLSVRQSP
jgi:hypothetical protein